MKLTNECPIESSSSASGPLKSAEELKSINPDFSKQTLSSITEKDLKTIEDFKIGDFEDIETKIIEDDLTHKFGNLKNYFNQKVEQDKEIRRKLEIEKQRNTALGTRTRASNTKNVENQSRFIKKRTPVPVDQLRLPKMRASQVEEIKRKSSMVSELVAFQDRRSRVSSLVKVFNEKLMSVKIRNKVQSNTFFPEPATISSEAVPDESDPKLIYVDKMSPSTIQIKNQKSIFRQKAKSMERIGPEETINEPSRPRSVQKIKHSFDDLLNRLQFLVQYLVYESDKFKSPKVQAKLMEEKRFCDEIILKLEKEKKQKMPFLKKIVKNIVFKKLWAEKVPKLKSQSFFHAFNSYTLKPVIMKGGDDLRQEVFAMQLFKKFNSIFQKEQTGIYIRPYEIMVTSSSAGFLEFLSDTTTVSGLKNKFNERLTLAEIYRHVFQDKFEFARKNFIESLAGYSLLCYLLQIKDRHNGNIMITHEGHMLHIDFGFLISNAPGNFHFETAPFKLTADYVALMDGPESEYFEYFEFLLLKGLIALNKNINEILPLIKVTSEKSPLPCFRSFSYPEFKARFRNQYINEPNSEALVC